MTQAKTDIQIMKILLKDFNLNSTITSLAKEMEMSRTGVWKVLKKLQAEKFVILAPVGTGKTSIYKIKLNWENSLVKKTLALALEHEAAVQRRWVINFSELEDKVDFLILYGSILYSPQKANDIDILSIISKKNVSMEIENIVAKVQKTQLKHIHNIIFAQEGLRAELKRPNIAFVNGLKEGIVLFGQDKFVLFMQEMQK